MSVVLTVARDEVRAWTRSRLALVAAFVAALLVVVSVVSTVSRTHTEAAARAELQRVSEETFLSQPDRHPHRMVHYGHFVFRAPPPLAALDPGVDPYTGTSMFLEGHRQNSATFSAARSAPWPGVLGALTPAATYQLIVPLLLALVGFASIAREREGGTGAQLAASGVTLRALWLGKTAASGVLAGALLLPVAVGTVVMGEAASITVVFVIAYALYLAIWALIVSAASVWSKTAAAALVALLSVWVLFAVTVPRLAALSAAAAAPVQSKTAQDLRLAAELRTMGDGHNASDPAFAKLRAELLEEYGVDTVEELPVNFRGVVAQASEADLTDVMNRYADERMQAEAAQARLAGGFGIASPAALLSGASMALAGTDLSTHHRFLKEAEDVRFAFVQSLNGLHSTDLDYAADIARNDGPEAGQRARVAADNWQMLRTFDFAPAPPGERLARAALPLFGLAGWLVLAGVVGWAGTHRREVVSHD